MPEVGMEELVGDELVEMEVRRQEEMEIAILGQMNLVAQGQCCQEDNNVDEQEISCYGRNVSEHFTVFL